MQIQGENVSFTGLEAHWVDTAFRWQNPPLQALVERVRAIRLQQMLDSGQVLRPLREKIQHSLVSRRPFEDGVDEAMFRAHWLGTYLQELPHAAAEPHVVHTTAEPSELRRLHFEAGKGLHNIRLFLDDGMSRTDTRRVMRDAPSTWLGDLSRQAAIDPLVDTDAAWNRRLYELHAASTIVCAIVAHFWENPQE